MITYQREGLGYLVINLGAVSQHTKPTVFVQTDWDFPGLARTFGWSISDVQTDDNEGVDDLLQILKDINWFFSEGSAPLHCSTLLTCAHDKPIGQVIREAIARVEGCLHDGTDGTVDCTHCGRTATEFISAAREWLDDNEGIEMEDPGYFSGGTE